MSKTSTKTSISRLVKICARKGLKYVVISPGSRNAPLTLSFAENSSFECLNIPDERVAAFFALGMAQQLGQPVILCCTSGTALLNYAPAVAEAYYQKVPLLILSADRPVEWIDQRAGQTMRQKNVFDNYIKKSFELIEEAVQPEHLWYNDRISNEAVNSCCDGSWGPVHLNIPLRQPLYDLIPSEDISNPKLIDKVNIQRSLDHETIQKLEKEWINYSKILVIVGQHSPSSKFTEAIGRMAIRFDTVVLTETTSNVIAEGVLPSIDRLIDSISEAEYHEFKPDLIISCGAAIVSKKIRFMLRAMSIPAHWHIDIDDGYIDTYQSLTKVIPVLPEYFFELIEKFPEDNQAQNYKKNWMDREITTRQAHLDFLAEAPWSDLTVINQILRSIPKCAIHLASSTPIRYSQLFAPRRDCSYWCNRGVSGIDGCTSTAAGFAFLSEEFVTLITGDLAFFYDSNAFWHHHVPSNLRVILINNEGGNIFQYVKGPDTTNHSEQHFEAIHSTSAKGIADSYKIDYLFAEDRSSLETQLSQLYSSDQNRATILEIKTPRKTNIPILKKYFGFLQSESHKS